MNLSSSEKACRVCPKLFVPRRPLQAVCSPSCALKELKAKRRAEEALLKSQTRARREAAKTKPKLAAEAWAAFSKWIRWRDRDQTCIDCGKPFEPQKPGGAVDAGHYLARSIAPHLKFDERNVYAQRKNCNRPGGTTRGAFRAGVVGRIGEEATKALEADHEPRRYRADDYRAIRDFNRARLKAEQKEAS